MTGRLTDDPSILDQAELWRWIHPDQWVPDDSTELGFRPSSANFDEDEMSVVIAAECTGGLATLLENHEQFGVASSTAGEIRALGWSVVRAHDDQLPGHAHVLGTKSKKKGKQKLAKSCRMLKLPGH
jgi:hypothetical protein